MEITYAARQIIQKKKDQQESISVTQLANILNTTTSTLYRQIKRNTGLSTSQFIQECRLEKSLILLEQGNLTVREVAQKVGFKDSTYFIRLFKKRYGTTPKRLKRYK